MSASAISKKQCVTCNKSGGILTCDGCQQSFCGKHVFEHRQELGGQLDNIIQEHDLLQQELQVPSLEKNSSFHEIDKWEKESIAKIQAAAEAARKSLQELLEQSKGRVSKECDNIKEKLRSAREADDFSEFELVEWKKQLIELQQEYKTPSSANLSEDKRSPVYLMTLTTSTAATNQSASSKDPPPKTSTFDLGLYEKFLQKLGPVTIEDGGHLAQYDSSFPDMAYIRGRFLYSKSCYTIRFKIEKFQRPYRIFFGCMSSQAALKEEAFCSPHSVGWFGSNQVYEHGRCSSNVQKYGYNTAKLEVGDELDLILDCDNKQIRLFHARLKQTCTLSVNTNLAPFPWQYLVVLGKLGDCVKIIPNS